MNHSQHIGTQLLHKRVSHGISTESMEIYLGISHDELLEFETGVRMLSWGKIQEYAKQVGLEIKLTVPKKISDE